MEERSNVVLNDTVQNLNALNLITNTKKTVMMPLTLREKDICYDVTVNSDKIEQVSSTKFLGLKIDPHITWSEHINDLCSKVNSGVFLINQLKQTVSQRILLQVYYANIYSHLAYGINIWGNTTQELMSKILICQKRAVRAIDNLAYAESCVNSFKKLKLLTIPAIYAYFSVLYLKKNNCGSKFREIHTHDTRNKDNYAFDMFRGEFAKKSPNYTAKKIYNHLPLEIKNIQNYNKFKTILRSYLIEKCPYEVKELFLCM